MGFEILSNPDTGPAKMVARCDNCKSDVDEDAIVMYSGVSARPYLVCSLACSQRFVRQMEELDPGHWGPWQGVALVAYWVEIGAQLNIPSPGMLDEMRARATDRLRERVLDQIYNGEPRDT